MGNNKSNDSGFLIRNHGTTRNHGSRSTFSSAKRKKNLLIQNSVFIENVLQAGRGNQDVLRWKENKETMLPADLYPKGMAKEHF